MKKYIFLSIISFLFLSGCSKMSTGLQNITGTDIEAYYSDTADIVCLTTTNTHGIYCLPASQVNIKKLKTGEWTVI